MILIIDNYDSFTYNLYQYMGTLYPEIEVVRNDEITIEEIEKLHPEAIVISPGPGYPKDAGISIEVIKTFCTTTPILGICLGHQAIAEAFGGKVVPAHNKLHGKASEIIITVTNPLFSGLPEKISVARYHSLIVDSVSLPPCLRVIGVDETGQIMAIRHKEYPTYGVQFHPESILTDSGKRIISNFINDVVGIEAARVKIPPVPENERVELKPFIAKVCDGISLTEEEAYKAMDIIMSDRATNAQIAGLLTALRMKGETIDEITGFAKVMRAKMADLKNCEHTLDIVGTGGDLAFTFNISTTSSFVIAGAGQLVAKHGNRSVSSKSGAADVLESLGVKINTTPDEAAKCIGETGISFLFAQNYHAAMRFVGPARKQLGIRTVFNVLGPLANPAKAEYMILGVCDENLLELMARVLMNLGIKAAMLVMGRDRLDEISISDKTAVCEINGGKIIKYDIDPRDYGMRLYSKSDVVGGTPEENAKTTLGILKGKITGAKRDIVLLNSGCALYITGKAKSIEEGIEMAKDSIDNGKSCEKLQELIEFTNR